MNLSAFVSPLSLPPTKITGLCGGAGASAARAGPACSPGPSWAARFSGGLAGWVEAECEGRARGVRVARVCGLWTGRV